MLKSIKSVSVSLSVYRPHGNDGAARWPSNKRELTDTPLSLLKHEVGLAAQKAQGELRNRGNIAGTHVRVLKTSQSVSVSVKPTVCEAQVAEESLCLLH